MTAWEGFKAALREPRYRLFLIICALGIGVNIILMVRH
jgi:hypothetical protein